MAKNNYQASVRLMGASQRLIKKVLTLGLKDFVFSLKSVKSF